MNQTRGSADINNSFTETSKSSVSKNECFKQRRVWRSSQTKPVSIPRLIVKSCRTSRNVSSTVSVSSVNRSGVIYSNVTLERWSNHPCPRSGPSLGYPPLVEMDIVLFPLTSAPPRGLISYRVRFYMLRLSEHEWGTTKGNQADERNGN